MKMKKKITAIIMSAILAAGAIGGCSKSDKSEQGSADVPKITVYMPYFSMGNAECVVEEINKKAGVDLTIMESGGSQEGVQRSALIVTTGEKVNWVNIDASQPFKEWGEEGFINDLAPYLEKYKDELPVLNMIANDPIFKGFKGKNGEVYAIPSINYITNIGLRMNQAWLDEIGAQAPTTLAELTDILRKFKTIAAKEDGAVPFTAGGIGDFRWAFYAHGGNLFMNNYPRYYEKDGEFYPYDISDMNKEAVKYLRTLHQEGLVNSDWQVLVASGGRTRDNFVGGKAGMIFTSGGCDEELYANKGTVSAWLPAPEGPTGIASYGGGAPFWLMNVIPSSIDKEEDIYNTLKFIEWMHSEEGRKICCFGIEGRHYEMTADGKYDYTAHKDNMDADFGIGQNSRFEWGWVSPYRGALDPKYGTVQEAIANMKSFEMVKKQPVDESYMDYIAVVTKYVDPYKYDSYISDDLQFAANSTLEYVDKFYSRAITEKNFDFDKEWETFANSYMTEYNGQECLDIFKSVVKEIDG